MWMPAWNHLEPPGTPSEPSQRFDDVWSKLLDPLEANCAAAWSSRVCFFWSYFAVSHDVVDKSWQSHLKKKDSNRFTSYGSPFLSSVLCHAAGCLTACIHLAQCAGSSRGTLKKCQWHSLRKLRSDVWSFDSSIPRFFRLIFDQLLDCHGKDIPWSHTWT